MLKVRIFQPKFNYGISTIRNFSSLQPHQKNKKMHTVFDADSSNSLTKSNFQRISVRQFSISLQRLSTESAAGAGALKEELIFKVPEKPPAPSGAEAVSSSSDVVFTLPDKPSPVDVSQIGEASFESLGLATWWPSGRMQYFLENVSTKN